MKKARIVHLTSVHSAMDNRIYHRECVSLAKAGFAVTIVGRHRADAVTEYVTIKAIPTENGRIARMVRGAWRVYREALRLGADLYHFHDPELIPVGLLLRAHGRRVVYDIHEDLPRRVLSKHYLPRWSRRFVSWITEQLERITCAFFSALVPVTPHIADRFRVTNKRIVTVHNYPRPAGLIAASAASPWRERNLSVAYIGGVTVNRGIREMVTAMSLLPESLPATLEIAGNEVPDYCDPVGLEQSSGWKRVRHHGPLDGAGVVRLLSQVRAGIVVIHATPAFLPSMPLKMFEYMAAGLPVIASDFPAWRRMLGDIGCAIFVDPVKPDSLAGAIEYVLTHPVEAEDMGLRGQVAVREKFNWEAEEKKLVALYTELLGPAFAQ